ncbi:MAG TPA: hypothetical protein VK483_05245 [Chitinophagaceae bacterium]|nr:hypothetical protein [Chitinophagaceae bacterium]
MVNESDKIKPGEIKFLEAAPPPLVAGEYILNATQSVNIPADKKNGQPSDFLNNSTTFHVSAPRFTLDLSDIYNVYPAAGSTGSYFYSLPHIVFNRKTLPWERARNNNSNSTPWMTLLVLDEDEINSNKIEVKNIPLKDIFNKTAAPNTIIPGLNLEPWEKAEQKLEDDAKVPKYKVMDIPFKLYADVVPYEDEMPYLTHARQVDSGNKEIAGINAKGWFSVLIANRIPSKGKNNMVFLVSLEGHDITKANLVNPENQVKNIRLVVLHSWNFKADGLDFGKLIDALNKNIRPLKIDADKDVIPDDTMKKALQAGFTPLNMGFRNGTKNVVWYRGPLTPVNIIKPSINQFPNADTALRYDRSTNMFDVSYSAAWQLGRLMALKEKNYITALKNWKGDYENNYWVSIAQELLHNKFNMIFPGKDHTAGDDAKPELVEILNKVESDEVMKNFILELWGQKLPGT